MLPLLAENDISGVPAEFVKSFMIMVGFLIALGGGIAWGRRGSKESPLHVEQPVDVNAQVTHAPVYAHRTELDAVKADIERRTRENLRQHEDNREQLTAVIAAGNERLQSMLTALHDMETRMTTATLAEIRGIHERINPLGEQVAAHKAEIKGMRDRIQQIWEMLQSVWSHVFSKPAPKK